MGSIGSETLFLKARNLARTCRIQVDVDVGLDPNKSLSPSGYTALIIPEKSQRFTSVVHIAG